MSAPRLSRRLVLEEGQRLSDGAGGYSTSWVALGTLWAAVEPIGGRERAGESVTVSAVGYRIIVRAARQGAVSRPKPDQRLREGGRIFRITAVAETGGAGHYLTCHATEEVLA